MASGKVLSPARRVFDGISAMRARGRGRHCAGELALRGQSAPARCGRRTRRFGRLRARRMLTRASPAWLASLGRASTRHRGQRRRSTAIHLLGLAPAGESRPRPCVARAAACRCCRRAGALSAPAISDQDFHCGRPSRSAPSARHSFTGAFEVDRAQARWSVLEGIAMLWLARAARGVVRGAAMPRGHRAVPVRLSQPIESRMGAMECNPNRHLVGRARVARAKLIEAAAYASMSSTVPSDR